MKKASRLVDVAASVISQLVGRILRRAAFLSVGALFALIALYHFTVAGMLALSDHFGLLNARLIVAGLYTLVAAICVGIFISMSSKSPAPQPSVTAEDGEALPSANVAMLVEALTLGYSLSRKPKR